MSNTEGQGEPSMEEILASIRRIISEDEPAEGEAAPDEKEAAAEAEQEEPLELTQEVKEDGSVVDLKEEQDAVPEVEEPAPEPSEEDQAAPEEPVELVEEAEEPVQEVEEPAAEPEPEVEEVAAVPPTPAPSVDQLLAPATVAAGTSSLEQIVQQIGADKHDFASSPTRTLEDVVRDALLPELKLWLDQNLPGLVERIVREEIKKMVRRAEDR